MQYVPVPMALASLTQRKEQQQKEQQRRKNKSFFSNFFSVTSNEGYFEKLWPRILYTNLYPNRNEDCIRKTERHYQICKGQKVIIGNRKFSKKGKEIEFKRIVKQTMKFQITVVNMLSKCKYHK